MKKVYSVKIFHVIKNIILGVFSAAAFTFIVWIFLGFVFKYELSKTQALIIAVVFYILNLFLVIKGNWIKVEIEDNILRYIKGSKVLEFDIENSSFKAENINNSSLTLEVKTTDGKTETIDLELLGLTQYYSIISDLNIDGKTKAHKIDIKTKGE